MSKYRIVFSPRAQQRLLADNRHLNIDIQETYNMLHIDIERLSSYRLTMDKGMEKDMEKATHLIALYLLRKGTPASTIAEAVGHEFHSNS